MPPSSFSPWRPHGGLARPLGHRLLFLPLCSECGLPLGVLRVRSPRKPPVRRCAESPLTAVLISQEPLHHAHDDRVVSAYSQAPIQSCSGMSPIPLVRMPTDTPSPRFHTSLAVMPSSLHCYFCRRQHPFISAILRICVVSVISNRFKHKISCDSTYCFVFPARPERVLSHGFVVAYKILAVSPLTACYSARLTLSQVLGSAASFCSTLNLGIRRCVGHA